MQSAKTNQNVEQAFFTIARDIKHRLTETVTASTEVDNSHTSYAIFFSFLVSVALWAFVWSLSFRL
jgi:hypothetical protein